MCRTLPSGQSPPPRTPPPPPPSAKASVENQLKDWAGLVPGADLGGQAANKRKQAEVLRIWQLTLSR